MIKSFRSFIAALLVTSFPLLCPAANKPETPMGQSMDVINSAFKDIVKALKAPDAAQQATYAQWAATIQAEAVKCKSLVPAKVAAMPPAEQPAALEAFKKDMERFIGTVGKLEQALGQGRWADAEAALSAMKKEKASGHEEFKAE